MPTNDRLTARLAEVGQEFNHGFALSLSRINDVLEALGRPQDRLPPTFHVAGTNGKGSTCAYLRAIAEAAGLKAHVFTSPNLIRVNERIRLAGALVDDDQFLEAIERVAATNITVTYFELITAAAMLLFAEIPADILALETGLGGAFDSPTLSINAGRRSSRPVDMDHAHLLGDTIAKIAGERRGSSRRVVPSFSRARDRKRAPFSLRAPKRLAPRSSNAVLNGIVGPRTGACWCKRKTGCSIWRCPAYWDPHQVDNAASPCARC